MNSVEEIYNITASPEAINDSIADLEGNGDNATQLKADVSTGSTVARHRFIRWVIAYAMWSQRVLFNIYKDDVRALAKDGHYGTTKWWAAKALQFQYGHDLIHTQKDAYYAEDDPEARIVGRAVCIEGSHKVIIKAVRVIGGVYAPLNSFQYDSFVDYLQEIGPPMTIVVITAPSDRLWLDATVVYDATQGLPGIQSNTEAAINQFIKDLPFNGVLNLTQLKLAMLNVNGVTDVVFNSAQGRAAASPTWHDINRIYMPYAGWMTVDQDNPLSDTLNWISSNV